MSAGCCGTKKTKLNGGPQMARENQSGIEQQPLRTSIRHCSHSNSTKGQKCGYPYGHLNPSSGRNRSTLSKQLMEVLASEATLLEQTAYVCCYNGTTPTTNGTLRNGLIPIASAEMCFYCFDVLYSHLHNMETPSTPEFTNEPL
ncbi:AMMECR1-like protein [Chionoecetes opilio]|uniref:AMMECR1-like protein n=1 Tax=Chionoecetes opilio TaxID=41210 RepID=A0A8J4XQL8_CHIOP|nr:AMMECR1-like protein [Chionoecetes opilio]